MDSIIIKNLNFAYSDNNIFSEFNLNVKKNKFTLILGLNGTGKSTLCQILNNNLSYNGYISIEKEELSRDNKTLSELITIIDNKINLKQNTVMESLWCGYESSFENFKNEIGNLCQAFEIENLLYKKIKSLNKNEQNLIYILSKIISNPSIIILDDPFLFLNKEEKEKVLSYLKSLSNRTILLLSSDIEDVLYADEINFISDGKNQLTTNINKLSKYEKKLRKIGFSLPFSIDLSKKLGYYNLLDDEIISIDEMVDVLWK